MKASVLFRTKVTLFASVRAVETEVEVSCFYSHCCYESGADQAENHESGSSRSFGARGE